MEEDSLKIEPLKEASDGFPCPVIVSVDDEDLARRLSIG